MYSSDNPKKGPKETSKDHQASGRASSPVRRIVMMSLLTAMGLALSAVESTFPPLLPFPGVKLGLANIVTLIGFSLLNRKRVCLLVCLRLILASFVLGSFATPGFWISCTGGLLSLCSMALCVGLPSLSIVGLSLAGAAFHNLGQILAVLFLLGNRGILYYLPWLLLWSIPMGLFTGFAAKAALSALAKTGHALMDE